MPSISLRFKAGSTAYPKWLTKRISELDLYISDGNYGELYPRAEQMTDSGIPFIRANNIKQPNLVWDDMKYISTELHAILTSGHLKTLDILVTTRGEIGAVALVDEGFNNANINAQICLIRSKDQSRLNSRFLIQQLMSPFCQKQFKKLQTGSALKQLPRKNLGQIKLYIPNQHEQKKVASFLSVVDQKISLLSQKHELITAYKKGVMEEIFNQEVRFKDDAGNQYPEWRHFSFGEIYSFLKTNSFSRENLSYESGLIKNIHYGDIHTKFKSNFKIEDEIVPFISQKIDTSKISADSFCKESDLVIADASEDYKDIGKAIEIISLGNQKLVAGLHTYLARPLTSEVFKGFGGYLMQSSEVRKQIQVLATGISVLGISKSNLSKISLSIPSVGEQIKITRFLSKLDEKISVVKHQLDLTKQYKKGLLQQMFV